MQVYSFFCVDKLFVSSFVLSLFIYYKRLRRRRSDHLDFPNDEAIVFCVHGHVEHSFFVRVDEKTRDAFEGNVALTDAKADAARLSLSTMSSRRSKGGGTFDPRRGNPGLEL